MGHPIEAQFSEQIVRLPASAPFLPVANAPPVNGLPALENGFLTLASFNRLSKLNAPTIALWSQLLRALPRARMMIGGMSADDSSSAKLREWFEQCGVANTRLVFQPRCDMQAYLRLHHQVDICLDAIPYGGGTTTYQALWMGVPTLSLVGQTMPRRLGLNVLSHVNLQDGFVAENEADYLAKALYWADHLKELGQVRTALRESMRHSVPGHPEVIAQGVATALRSMWQRWCQGLPPKGFEV